RLQSQPVRLARTQLEHRTRVQRATHPTGPDVLADAKHRTAPRDEHEVERPAHAEGVNRPARLDPQRATRRRKRLRNEADEPLDPAMRTPGTNAGGTGPDDEDPLRRCVDELPMTTTSAGRAHSTPSTSSRCTIGN